MNSRLVFIVVALLICNLSRGQSKYVTIDGKIEGEVSTVHAVSLYYYDQCVTQMDILHRYDTLVKVYEGRFKLNIPVKNIGKIGQLSVYFDSTNNQDNDIVDEYVVERNDKLSMQIEVRNKWITDVKTSGPGSSKYNCRSSLIFANRKFKSESKEYEDSVTKTRKAADTKSAPSIINYWASIGSEKLKFYQRQQNLLNSNKKDLSVATYEIMKADVAGEFYSSYDRTLIDLLRIILILDTSENLQSHIELLEKHKTSPIKVKSLIIPYSPQLIAAVYYKEVLELSFKKRVSYIDVILSFSDLYYQIKQKYKGILRERLLTEMLINTNQNLGLISMGSLRKRFINDALQTIKSPLLKNAIQNSAITRAAEGDKAFNFKLPDTTGKIVSLENFKGNIVLMDIWSTGCSGCLMFNNTMITEILPQIPPELPIKFVSISTDQSKETWMKSVYSRKYTTPGSINLRAQSPSSGILAFSQIPIIKYYGVNYSPFILLIDQNGKIAAEFTNQDDAKTILSKIQALSKDN